MSNRTWCWICAVIILCFALYYAGKVAETKIDLWTIRSMSHEVQESAPAVPAWREQ